MHFINSLLLAFAAAAIAAPTPANVLGRDASEVDQMQSGLEGASSVRCGHAPGHVETNRLHRLLP
jgi:hypothetical protein